MGANFYIEQGHVGTKSRADASVTKLKELNNYVNVTVSTADLGMELFSNYHVVVFTEVPTTMEDIVGWNKQMREKNIGTIMSQSLGLYGYVFVDFGDNHIVRDADGERTNNFVVSQITKEEDHLIVTVHEEKRNSFGDHSHVVFREVEGSTELNQRTEIDGQGKEVSLPEPIRIQQIDGFSFKLFVDPSTIGEYTGGGIVEDQKVPQPL